MKYTYEDKLKIVEDYKKLGPSETARKWKSDRSYILRIFNIYKTSELKPHSKRNNKYTAEFKLKVVNAYIQGEGSLEVLANKYSVKAITTIRNWYHIYQSLGEEGLRNMKKIGRPKKIEKLYKNNKVNIDKLLSSEKAVSDYTLEEVKALKEELLRLRCHEEFSKKFEALTQEYLEKKNNK